MDEEMGIIEKAERLLNIMNQSNKKPKDYGTGDILYHSEIHTIEAIYNHKNVNASELSSILGITNGAVSQVTNKLIKKKLIEQYQIPNNKKDVFYKLTEHGEKVNALHNEYHKKLYNKIHQYFSASSKENIKTINNFLDWTIQNWPTK